MFEPLFARFKFSRDLAASVSNTKCSVYFTREDNVLLRQWAVMQASHEWDWCNPPYSRGNLEAFTYKAREEVKRGWAGMLLVPATVGAGWFQKNVLVGHDVLGGGGTNPAAEKALQGWDLRLGGNGYQLVVRFLKRRVGFWKDGKPMPKNAAAKTDSALIEYRPRRLL